MLLACNLQCVKYAPFARIESLTIRQRIALPTFTEDANMHDVTLLSLSITTVCAGDGE